MTPSARPLTLATWNLEQASPRTRGARQLALMQELDVDVWLLTEVRDDAGLPYAHVARSPARGTATSGQPMRWSAVCSRWPLQERRSGHEGLALAVVQAPEGPLVAACSVLPWRGAGARSPGNAAARYPGRTSQARQICRWGSLSGPRDPAAATRTLPPWAPR